MNIKNKIFMTQKNLLDLELTILLFNELNNMLPIHIVHLSYEIIM